MDYDPGIIGQRSILPSATFGSPRCGSGLAAPIPHLCHPDPDLAETLAPEPFSLNDRHQPGKDGVSRAC